MAQPSIHIVAEHLEGIKWQIFEEFRESITLLVEKRNGIYALYKGDGLYYVGLARNLRSRLKRHLRDRHNGLWDRFSVYLTKDEKHLRELEALLLRVLKPVGNSQRGRLKGSHDLKPTLEQDMAERQKLARLGLLGAEVAKPRSDRKKGAEGKTTFLRATYKGQVYKATLRADGSVRYGTTVYTSLSAAGRAVVKRRCNGWRFWRYKDAEGAWLRMATQR